MSETIVCVGGVVLRAGRILLVRQSPGHSLEGQWTVPWGQVDAGESPTAAVIREVREEAGVVARVNALLGVQELPDPWLGMIGILFLCEHLDGEPMPDQSETDAAGFFGPDQLPDISSHLEPLSAWLVRRVLAGDFSAMPTNARGPYGQIPTYL